MEKGENGRSYYSTFKFYDGKQRRLAIFGQEIDGDKLKVSVITCSHKDQYSKKAAIQAYEEGKITKTRVVKIDYDPETKLPILGLKTEEIPVTPIVFTIPIGENKPKFSLITFCKENYLQKRKGIAEVSYDYFIQKVKNAN